MLDFSDNYKKLWKEWGIRILVVSSLFLQIFLTLSAPLRRRGKFKWVYPLIWLAYLVADWVAAFALGILSDIMHSSLPGASKAKSPSFFFTRCTDKDADDHNHELIGFWAPFLLAHLGGPDSITAFALEDNELWLRHLLILGVHLVSAFYVFALTLPNNHLLVPTLLIFMVGIIRYTERTRALYRASNLGLHRSMPAPPDPGTDYARLIDVYTNKKSMGIPVEIAFPEEPISGRLRSGEPFAEGKGSIEVVKSAHTYFATFKRLFLDHLIPFSEVEKSGIDFRSREHKYAFEVVEVELGLLYDIRYTKAVVIHRRLGYITRAVCFACVLAAAALFFYLSSGKCSYHRDNEAITVALLAGALLLDLIGFISLICSDWMIPSGQLIANVVGKLRRMRQTTYVSQYNLISYCLRRSKKTCMEKLILKLPLIGDAVERWLFTNDVEVHGFRDFIFEALRDKAEKATDAEAAKNLASCISQTQKVFLGLPEWIKSVEFEEAVLLWHIVTEVCYQNTDEDDKERDSHGSFSCSFRRRFSKHMSDYMHYLFVFKPSMIASLEGIRQTKYQEACAQAKSFINYYLRNQGNQYTEKGFCVKLLSLGLLIEDKRSEFVLFDAWRIAKSLMKAREEAKHEEAKYKEAQQVMWEGVSEMWVELLSYAASHCSAKHHTEQLVSGGELLTSIWLMMAHMGIGSQFRKEYSHSKAKLVAAKYSHLDQGLFSIFCPIQSSSFLSFETISEAIVSNVTNSTTSACHDRKDAGAWLCKETEKGKSLRDILQFGTFTTRN